MSKISVLFMASVTNMHSRIQRYLSRFLKSSDTDETHERLLEFESRISVESVDDVEPDVDDDFGPPILNGYADLRAYLLESEEFKELSHDLELGLQASYADTLTWLHVREQIVKAVASSISSPSRPVGERSFAIIVPWLPRQFLQEQYGHLPNVPNLGSVITLSGAEDNVYAATAETYIRRTWPRYGPLILATVQNALDSPDGHYDDYADHYNIRMRLKDDSTEMDVLGLPLFGSSATEILVWLSTACRASTMPDGLQSCRMRVSRGRNWKKLSFTSELEIVEGEAAHDLQTSICWHDMFRNPVIAYGYPVPPRKPYERGLEISFDMMLTLGRTFWAAIYDGALMLKGFNTLLIPTLKVDASIVWHLTVNRSGERLSYNDGVGSSCISSISDAMFVGARHFVGWAESANYLVGKSSPIIRVSYKFRDTVCACQS